jgi:dihydrolipoamide dehydrogenase
MSEIIRVPDIGDFKNVDVLEVLVQPGDRISAEQPLITLETDKATMDIPAPAAGVVLELKVKSGDKVSQGSPILLLDNGAAATNAASPAAAAVTAPAPAAPAVAAASATGPRPPPAAADQHTSVLVLGGGPGGYTAAFRAADLGLKVTLVERHPTLGGVCLNVGCIPSKALLHAAQILNEARAFAAHGIDFGEPRVDLGRLRTWKESVTGKLTKGLAGLAKARQVTVLQGTGRFTGPHTIAVQTARGETTLAFDHAIIAAGSQAVKIPGLPWDDPRLMDSTDALTLADIPRRLLVVGGGIIGLEMATVYDALGAKVTVVELSPGLIPGCDRDLVKPLEKRIRSRYENIFTGVKVAGMTAEAGGLRVRFEGAGAPAEDLFDRVLVAVGRAPNGARIGAEAAGVQVDARGFIPVDAQQRTNVPHIHAIGDITGQPMLAHKATHEAKIAAEVIAGHKAAFDARTIPSVAYTDPEVAWMGQSEDQLKASGIAYEKGLFPWAASGRSLSLGRDEGLTKVLFEAGSRRVLGAGLVGPNAGELIAEAVLALEMGADASDIALSIHPHPTLSETFAFAAEAPEGPRTHLPPPRRG